MFKWYAGSYECIVRLTDVPSWSQVRVESPYSKSDTNDTLQDLDHGPMKAHWPGRDKYRDDYPPARYLDRERPIIIQKLLGSILPYLENSMWFTRGWTLQELLAPDMIVFCNSSWEVIGHVCKSNRCTRNLYAYGLHITTTIAAITGIPERYLEGLEPLRGASIAQRMSWASRRTTTRLEDEAYCLLGLFDVSMPMVYGEGGRAFRRLQLEIIQRSTDQSIFAWSVGSPGDVVSIFATSPAAFANSAYIMSARRSGQNPYAITNNGLQLHARVYLQLGQRNTIAQD